jgi:hypothetical protein
LLPDGDTRTIHKSVDCRILSGARRNLTTFLLAIECVGPEFTRNNQAWHGNRYDIGIDRLLTQTKRKIMRKSFWKDALASLPPSVQVRYAASFEAAERLDALLDLSVEAWGSAKHALARICQAAARAMRGTAHVLESAAHRLLPMH